MRGCGEAKGGTTTTKQKVFFESSVSIDGRVTWGGRIRLVREETGTRGEIIFEQGKNVTG